MNRRTLDSVLRRIGEGALSRGEAAAALGVSERTVNRLMVEHSVSRPPSPVHEQRQRAEERRQLRLTAAGAVVGGVLTPEQAAKGAQCSERTIYRWIKRLEKASESVQKRRKSRKSS
jgi:DNA-binding CsgD family transcriptional regulator